MVCRGDMLADLSFDMVAGRLWEIKSKIFRRYYVREKINLKLSMEDVKNLLL